MEPVALDKLTAQDFAPRLHDRFQVALRDGVLELELVEVTPHPYAPRQASRRRGFSLVFRSALPGHLPQGVYPLQSEVLGTLELFLVPIGPKDGGMCYEAVFN